MVCSVKRAGCAAASSGRASAQSRVRTPHSILVHTTVMIKILLAAVAAASLAAAQPARLIDLRQLTHGGQNAEAYWGPDGKRLIFQTTRQPYDCDQIFVMN